MARLCSPENAPSGGTKRRGGGFASFFFGRFWVKYWIVSDQYALCLTVEQKGMLRSASVTLLDAVGGRTGERAWRRIAPGGQRAFSSTERISVRSRNSAVTFQQDGWALRVFGCAERWAEEQPLLFDLRLTGLPGVVAAFQTPFPGHARWFAHRGVTGVLRAEGRAEMGGEEYLFAPAHSLGLAEEGTGVFRGWPPMDRAAAAGWIDGAPAALLLDGASQGNVLMMGGRTWKLGPVAWGDPGAVSPDPAMQSASPRQFIGTDGRVTLTFDPLAEQRGTRRRLFRRGAEIAKVFGRFSGSIRLDNGRTVTLRRLSGVMLRHPGGP